MMTVEFVPTVAGVRAEGTQSVEAALVFSTSVQPMAAGQETTTVLVAVRATFNCGGGAGAAAMRKFGPMNPGSLFANGPAAGQVTPPPITPTRLPTNDTAG
jgi:hypothetical protein